MMIQAENLCYQTIRITLRTKSETTSCHFQNFTLSTSGRNNCAGRDLRIEWKIYGKTMNVNSFESAEVHAHTQLQQQVFWIAFIWLQMIYHSEINQFAEFSRLITNFPNFIWIGKPNLKFQETEETQSI